MRDQQGILSRIQRRWAWVGFLLLAINGPIVAKAMGEGDQSWMMSVTVAAIVAFVIIIDDVERRRVPAKSPSDGPVD